MKNFLIFIAGALAGALLTISLPQHINLSTDVVENDGITLFSETGDAVNFTQFRVFQVVESGNALALAQSNFLSSLLPDDTPEPIRNLQIPTETVVLLLAGEVDHYYDNKIVDVPDNKQARQVGIYKYMTSEDFEKTVPVVKFSNKQ